VRILRKRKRAAIGEFVVPAEQNIPAMLEAKIEWIVVFSLAHDIERPLFGLWRGWRVLGRFRHGQLCEARIWHSLCALRKWMATRAAVSSMAERFVWFE
jgi:hypothetical protein